MMKRPHFRSVQPLLVALGLFSLAPALAQEAAPPCPAFGWKEGLGKFQKPGASFPTDDTQNVPTPDCNFHQWSFEAFVWATALDGDGPPRFMTLPTPDDLRSAEANAAAEHPRALRLAARSTVAHDLPGFTEGAGAFVQADGNVQVALNGAPVYASVHMNRKYFDTAKQNLISTGAYQRGSADATFPIGAAVFKATWLRLDPGQPPPQGAYLTEAEVPVLTVLRTKSTVAIVPVPGKFVKAPVALVGLHVVGVTENHPEFLWGTFEHQLNAPRVADNSFTTTGANPNSFTFYQANVPFSLVNLAHTPPTLSFNALTQRFQPVTNTVLENATGGENQQNGPANVQAVSGQGQAFLSGEKAPQSLFGNYILDGTVWMKPGLFNLNSDQSTATGSVNLANTTAETFQQFPTNTDMQSVKNCFMCHNAGSYSFDPSLPKLPNRLVAVSHVLAIGTEYAVPNMITGPVKTR